MGKEAGLGQPPPPLGASALSCQAGESPWLTEPVLRQSVLSPLGLLQEGGLGVPDRSEDSPRRAEGLTWLLGSQGTERGISACLQDTMYFLGERGDDNLGPSGAHLFSAGLLCARPCAQPSRVGGTPMWPGRLGGHTEGSS